MNIAKFLIENTQKYSDKEAIIFEDRIIDFLELKNNSFKLSNYLSNFCKNEQIKVAIFLSNTPEAVYSFLGVFSLGGVLIPLDFMLTEEEIITFLNHSQADILITQIRKDVNLESLKKRCPNLKEIILCKQKIDGFSFFDEIIDKTTSKEPIVSINPNSISSIFYTSGTTGSPKGVMLSYNNLNNPVDTINHFLGISENDIFLTGGIPFSHLGGLDYILLMVRFASTMVLMERFNPFEFLKCIEKYKVTIFCIVPSMYVAILSLKEYENFDLSSLRYAVVFGAPSSPILLQKFHKVCPKAVLLNGWGMTETSAPNTFSPKDETKINSIGKFGFRMEAKIIDENGVELGHNKKGELVVKGDGVMLGYYKNDELTKETLDSDGWLKTGDIAYYDEEGLFYICGRKKDMIKVAGEIVFCVEVEEKIALYPKVKEVAVIGIADKIRGEVPKAFIVPKENEEIDLQDLKDFLRKHLAHFKIPHYFAFVKDLPKNRVGKIDKIKLAEMEK